MPLVSSQHRLAGSAALGTDANLSPIIEHDAPQQSAHDLLRMAIKSAGCDWGARVTFLGQDCDPSHGQASSLIRATTYLASHCVLNHDDRRARIATKVFVRVQCYGTELEVHWKEVGAYRQFTGTERALERQTMTRTLRRDALTCCSVYRSPGGLDVRLFLASDADEARMNILDIPLG